MMPIPIYLQLSGLVIIEILCHTIIKDTWSIHAASIIYLSVGLLIPVIALVKKETPSACNTEYPKLQLESFLICILLLIMVLHYGEIIFTNTVIDYRMADMLAVIDVMSSRFLQGNHPYDVIPEIWDGMQPIYLPAMWLPFSLHHLMNADMRWISIMAMTIGTMLLYFNFNKSYDQGHFLFITIPVFLIWTLILSYDHTLISFTQEGIVIGYYMLLCFALIKRHWFFVGITIALCLLSRYALAPWAFVFLVSLIILKKYKEAKKLMIGTICTALPLVILTGSYAHFPVIFGMTDQYLSSVLADTNKYIPVINSNLGLAKYLSVDELPLLHKVLAWSSIAIPIIGFYSYRPVSRWLKHKVSFEFYAICMLKISLVCFYNLLIIPYPYLFYTSTFVSLFILVGYNLQYKQQLKSHQA